jgi:hypothetical protein
LSVWVGEEVQEVSWAGLIIWTRLAWGSTSMSRSEALTP